MINPQTLKGFRDFLPQEARKRQFVINTLKSVFELYGFEPLETPALEYEEILAGKYGDEGDQLMYRFIDRGGRKIAMRYDQTVPLARVVAQYQNASTGSAQSLPMPFKRYQIQSVWRAENTQKGRYREFLQCDADIVGVDSKLADAETIATAAKGLETLGFNNFTIYINDRRVFSELTANNLITEEEMRVAVVAIDKLKKIGELGVIDELNSKGLSVGRAREILRLIKEREKTDVIRDIDSYLDSLPELKKKCKFDPTLARGLNYYTGVIFEIEVEGYSAGSVCGGGRYDNLIGMFTNLQIPAVGFAFGFDRLIEAMDELNLFPSEIALSTTQVLVSVFAEELKNKSLEIVTKLRDENIPSEMYLGEIKEKNPLEKQLKYADQKQIPYVVILGPDEAEKNILTLKDLNTREQTQMTLDEIVKKFKV